MVRAVLIISVLAATSSFAEGRVALLAFKGPAAAKVRSAIEKDLCKAETCVKPGKGRNVEVDAVIVGAVKKGKGNKATLELSLYASEDEAPVSTRFPIPKNGALSAKLLSTIVGELRAEIGTAVANKSQTPIASAE